MGWFVQALDSMGTFVMRGLLLIAFGFGCGALPFSYWLGRWVLRQDIRNVGDGNPGASNVFRAGGKRVGWLALVLDYAKGFVPVLLFYENAVSQHPVLGIFAAIAPVFGHAFSPFLRWRGGKAVAVSFGVWSGLTLAYVPTVMGLAHIVGALVLRLQPEGWTVVLGFAAALVALWVAAVPAALFWVWLLNLAVVGWKHHTDLAQRPRREHRC